VALRTRLSLICMLPHRCWSVKLHRLRWIRHDQAGMERRNLISATDSATVNSPRKTDQCVIRKVRAVGTREVSRAKKGVAASRVPRPRPDLWILAKQPVGMNYCRSGIVEMLGSLSQTAVEFVAKRALSPDRNTELPLK